MSQSLEQSSEDQSESSEYDSNDESSHGSLEYHSGQEPESERQQIILVNHDEEFTFLNIRFPMPLTFPKPYIQLNELMSTVDHVVPKSYDGIQSIAKNPQHALGYIIHHFNIKRVSKSLCTYPNYAYDQVYYLTYINTSQFTSLQRYYKATAKQLQDALVQEQLELQIKYTRYLMFDDLPPQLLDCFL